MCFNEISIKFLKGKHLSDSSTVHNDLRQRDASSILLFKFALYF
jgi:hypothetical protein